MVAPWLPALVWIRTLQSGICAPCLPSLGGWGLQEGSRTIPAFQSLLSALIHLMNYTLKQLHTEGGAGRGEGDLAYN